MMAEINVLLGKLIEAQTAVRDNQHISYRETTEDIRVLVDRRNAAHDEIVRVHNKALVKADNLLLPQAWCGHPRADTVDGDGSGWCLRCKEIEAAIQSERNRILDACAALVAAIGDDDEVPA